MSDSGYDVLKDIEKMEAEEDTRVFYPSYLEGFSDFYKENERFQVWWIDKLDTIGEHLFSFDRKKIYNLFSDYPHNLTEEEVNIFNEENPYWKDFFKSRTFNT